MEATKLASTQVAAVILAAGASRRMGRDKRLIVASGKAVIEHTAALFLRQPNICRVLVVVEAGSPCCALAGLADVEFVENPEPSRGMLSSVVCALQAVAHDESVDAVAIHPADQPFVARRTVSHLVASFVASQPSLLVPRLVLPSGDQGRRGHPLFVARRLFSAALRCDPDVGLRQLLWQHQDAVFEVAVDDVVAGWDLDLPEHVSRLAKLAER